jgi:hypothetical protein
MVFYVERCQPGGWQLRVELFGGYDQDTHDRLGWDEMLWLCQLLLQDKATPSPGEPYPGLPPAPAVVDSLRVSSHGYRNTVSQVTSTVWTIERGDRFVSELCDHEAFAFLAAYTLDGREMWGGFKTYEQWLDHSPWRRNVEIAALLT